MSEELTVRDALVAGLVEEGMQYIEVATDMGLQDALNVLEKTADLPQVPEGCSLRFQKLGGDENLWRVALVVPCPCTIEAPHHQIFTIPWTRPSDCASEIVEACSAMLIKHAANCGLVRQAEDVM